MSRGGQTVLDVTDLLRIDIDAELRKVTGGQLLGAWQLPTELVRRAICAGAQHVDVRLKRAHASLSDDGTAISPVVLEQLACLIDRNRPPDHRHRALVALEEAQETALINLAGLKLRKFRIVARSQRGSYTLSFERGRVSMTPRAARGSVGTSISVSASGIGGPRARSWIEHACGFAPARVFLAGKKLPRPFDGALFDGPLDAPLRGRFSVPAEGQVARAWLLVHGVVSTHVCISPAPCFDAALELSDHVQPGAGPADLRAALQPLLAPLVGKAFTYLTGLARRAPQLPRPLRERVTELLLETVLRQGHLQTIERLSMFPGYATRDGFGWSDLATLRTVAERHGGRLSVLSPHDDPREYTCDDLCLLVSDAERALISELLSVRTQSPPAQTYRGSWNVRTLRFVRSTVTRGAAWLGRWIRRRPQVLAEAQLGPDETVFLAGLRQHLGASSPPLEAELCTGHGPVRRSRHGLLLPRDNASVRAGIQAVARDPSWVYPAAVAFVGDEAVLPAPARQRWQDAAGRPA